jgi:hypothetical protein
LSHTHIMPHFVGKKQEGSIKVEPFFSFDFVQRTKT